MTYALKRTEYVDLRHQMLTTAYAKQIESPPPHRLYTFLMLISVLDTNFWERETKFELKVARFISKVIGCPLSFFVAFQVLVGRWILPFTIASESILRNLIII